MTNTRLEKFKDFFWDPKARTFLGRTRDSWVKLIAFYIVLYTCLATIWTMYFYIFHLTIDEKYPKWQLEESLIGKNPGLGRRPESPHERVESALISFRAGEKGDYNHWVDDLDKYMQSMDLSKSNISTKQDCSSNRDANDLDTFCPFDNSSIPSQCSRAQNYSFPEGQPCILIKLNRIYGWKPEPYNSKPANFPEDVEFTPGNIQITCGGQQDVDKEHIGPIEYHPSGGIETKYYPFLNQPGYQSPYVMVHFKNPQANKLIYVECKAWAQNVKLDSSSKEGIVSFELFIEKKITPD